MIRGISGDKIQLIKYSSGYQIQKSGDSRLILQGTKQNLYRALIREFNR